MKWLAKKLSPHGDFWNRALDAGGARWPEFLEPIFVPAYALLFFLTVRDQRRGVVSNLSVIFPERSRLVIYAMALRVFTSFSFSITDAARCRSMRGSPPIDWEFEGLEPFSELAEGGMGAIILTAHMGNYDVGAVMYAQNFDRCLHTVRAPERDPEVQKLREKQLAEQGLGSYKVHFNKSESVLGLDLARLLSEGELVAIQGDRVLFEVSEVSVAFDEVHRISIPRGPFVLAQTVGSPIYPLFVIRRGWRRYRIVVLPPFTVEKLPARQREQGIAAATDKWIEKFRPVIREHWHQWYVFEPMFTPRSEVS